MTGETRAMRDIANCSRRGKFRRLILGSACLSCLILPALAPLCLAERPVDWEKKLEKGYYELSIGNVDEAIKWFRAKVKSYATSGACHTGLGLALKKKGKLAEAMAEFQKATEVEPGYAEAFYELGAMLESDKDYAGAAQSFEKYLTLKPDSNRRNAVAERLRFCKEQQR